MPQRNRSADINRYSEHAPEDQVCRYQQVQWTCYRLTVLQISTGTVNLFSGTAQQISTGTVNLLQTNSSADINRNSEHASEKQSADINRNSEHVQWNSPADLNRNSEHASEEQFFRNQQEQWTCFRGTALLNISPGTLNCVVWLGVVLFEPFEFFFAGHLHGNLWLSRSTELVLQSM